MTDTRVPDLRPDLDDGLVTHGAAVRASTWLDAARLAHWISGRGAVLVPHSYSGMTLPSGGSVTLRYRAPQSGRAIARVAIVEMTYTGATPPLVTMQLGAGTSARARVLMTRFGAYGGPVRLVSIDGAGLGSPLTRSTSTTDLTVTLTSSDGGACTVLSCTIYELPRAALETASPDYGVHLDSLFPRRTIQVYDALSVGAVDRIQRTIDGRRIGLSAYYGQGIGIVSASWSSLLPTPIPIVPRYHPSGSRSVSAEVRARVDSGSAEVRVVTSGAASTSSSMAITATSETWHGPVSASAWTEQPDEPSGIPAGGYETIDVQARVVSGGPVYVHGWSIYELT